MSCKIFTPNNQLKLTNVTVVRLKKCGKRFEVACHNDKVLLWRENQISDLDDVLQVVTVFTNVSKGEVSKNAELEKAFRSTNQTEICKTILKHGEIQISHKERKNNLDSLLKEIVMRISKMSINPQTKRPYAIPIIENALKEIHFSVNPTKNAKLQAIEAIKLLKSVIDIERMKLLMKISADEKTIGEIEEKLSRFEDNLILEDSVRCGKKSYITFKIEPGVLNAISDFVKKETNNKYFAELLNFHQVLAGEEDLAVL